MPGFKSGAALSHAFPENNSMKPSLVIEPEFRRGQNLLSKRKVQRASDSEAPLER